ncbi:MAG: acyl-CoA reductase [Flavobacteriaceae bacterium]|nr:acyl-CoA reductase [Flavobacteriaceae bacterium]MCY4266448.1 acyl-CoA reductase [Flavobacteriaceae bacterium]MCY4298214.1 acyl-CoA reductase [Flavobacteriaceae bacterium]
MKYRSSNSNLNTLDKIHALVALGEYINNRFHSNNTKSSLITKVLLESFNRNQWFTENYVIYALKKYATCFTVEKLKNWLSSYNLSLQKKKNIGLILPGNIPAVGFQDVLCTWLSGHHPQIKCSSKDDQLIPFLCRLIEKKIKKSCFEFVEKLKNYDAVIATGTNHTIHHFEFYFRNIPRILRKNRTSVAIIKGDESDEEIVQLGNDLFMYYGLGCRNVSKIYFPENYDLKNFVPKLKTDDDLKQSSKFHNNYTYQKAIHFLQNRPFIDGEFFLLQESCDVCSPISVIYYEFYKSIDWIKQEMKKKQNEIQCIVSKDLDIKNSIPFGTTQSPELWDYADGIDTLSFLQNL